MQGRSTLNCQFKGLVVGTLNFLVVQKCENTDKSRLSACGIIKFVAKKYSVLLFWTQLLIIVVSITMAMSYVHSPLIDDLILAVHLAVHMERAVTSLTT